jgi:hypothetical protein
VEATIHVLNQSSFSASVKRQVCGLTEYDYDHVEGTNFVFELRPPTGLLSIPQVIGCMSMENHGGMISQGKTNDSSTRALWQFCQQGHLVGSEAGGTCDENDAFGLTKYLFIRRRDL